MGLDVFAVDLNDALWACKRMPPEVAFAAITTFCNGWRTSKRLLEQTVQCRFGCVAAEAKDSLSLPHALACDCKGGSARQQPA